MPETKHSPAPDPFRTEELTADDILEVHNAVRAMQAETSPTPAADRTSEIDALDILAADDIVIAAAELPRETLPPTLPPTALPPRRANEPTRIIHRDVMERVQRALATKRTRSVLMLAAALGAWGFFASLTICGIYGLSRIAGHFGSHDASIAVSAPPSATASDESAANETSAPELAPLLENESTPNRLASISSSREDNETQTSHVSTASRGEEIFRRPSKTQVGVLRLPQSVHGLLVDGTPERVSGGSLILACGDHRIREPHSTARVVRVPCGKTVTL